MRTNVNLSIPGTDVRLGDKVRDVVSGFEGVATSYARHLTGCDRVLIEAPVIVHDGEAKSPVLWVDVMTLEMVDPDVVDANPIPRDVPAAG